ncbi:hypothetical protein AWF54_27070 [Escherichia coli]|nr:hypothetical protein AWF54_27070 [Escherichia coli]
MVIVFQQPLVSGFHEAELPLDDAKRVLHPGTDAGFHVFDVFAGKKSAQIREILGNGANLLI